MDKELYHPYTNDDNTRVNGAAALSHYIFTVKGGLQEYHDEIGEAYISAFVKANSDIINDGLAQKAKEELPALPSYSFYPFQSLLPTNGFVIDNIKLLC